MSEPDQSTLLEEPVRLGTRRSKLALWQANHIRDCLREHWGDRLQIELVEVVTEGDRIQDRPLNEVGGKGLFVKGIEEKLLAGTVDLAVHSMKDLPAKLPTGLTIACTPPRADPRDALVGPKGSKLAELPAGTRLGTSSLRRAALALQINPGIEIVPLRGNVPTRIDKTRAGECDVTLLAAAGLDRLGLQGEAVELLDAESFCPAACQGILALEIREGDDRLAALLRPLNDPDTAVAAAAERGFLARLEGGCQVPMACFARTEGATISVEAAVMDPSGTPSHRAHRTGRADQAESIGRDLAEKLLSMGADKVLAAFSGLP
jgi:hydroxymethylbilane synthase